MKNKLPRLAPLVIIAAAVALVAPRDKIGASGGPDMPDDASDDAAYNVAGPKPKVQSTSQSRERPTGDHLLIQVVAQLERRASASARLRHQVFLGRQQLYGIGRYWQQGSGEDLRVRLELQIAGQEAALLQISNGHYLWLERRLPTGRSVTGIDLRQLRGELRVGESNLDELKPGEANWLTTQPELAAHSGGLPSLLASLGENFSFYPPQAMRLAAPQGPEPQPASFPVFAIVGHWRHEKLAALLKESSGPNDADQEPSTLNSQPSALNSIPARLPKEVLLLVGQADLFPYRIEYRGLETPVSANRDGPPIPYQLSTKPMVVLEFTDVAFDVPIAPGQFDYSPGDAEWDDQTAALVQRLQRQRQVATHSGAEGASLPARQ
jgi:hypothetical protein